MSLVSPDADDPRLAKGDGAQAAPAGRSGR